MAKRDGKFMMEGWSLGGELEEEVKKEGTGGQTMEGVVGMRGVGREDKTRVEKKKGMGRLSSINHPIHAMP
jgi:hypothetical protein